VTDTTDDPNGRRCRILSLDGGGAKGFYTLGALREIEGMVGKPLHETFDLIFGTSTGAIIAALIGLGKSVEEIHQIYLSRVPQIMRASSKSTRSAELGSLADDVFGKASFSGGDLKTRIGIVAAKWESERPMIFKGDSAQAHGRKGTFVPGFGVSISDAVQASCSAFPFFQKKVVKTFDDDLVTLIDGGFCANNPTLYAIADALEALKFTRDELRIVSVGVGVYPAKRSLRNSLIRFMPAAALLQKALEINTQSMDQLCKILFKDVPIVRISETFDHPDLATDFLEHDLKKLNLLRQRGKDSFGRVEQTLARLME
jgi:predicted acylesterase/phospholipase RssA